MIIIMRSKWLDFYIDDDKNDAGDDYEVNDGNGDDDNTKEGVLIDYHYRVGKLGSWLDKKCGSMDCK